MRAIILVSLILANMVFALENTGYVQQQLPIAVTEAPRVLSISGNKYIRLGEVATFNIIVNNELSNYSIKVDDVALTSNQIQYEGKEITAQYKPKVAIEKDYVFDITLFVDGSNNNQKITFNMFVDSAEKKIAEGRVLTEDYKWEEVHQDKNKGIAMKYRLKATEFPLKIEGIQISTDMGESTDLITSLNVYRLQDKQQLGFTNNMVGNSAIDIPYSTEDRIASEDVEYLLVYSLKTGITLNTTFNIGVKILDSQKTIGIQHAYMVTSNLESVAITVVAKNKPIIMDNTIREYVGSTSYVVGKLDYELAEGVVADISYCAYDLTTKKRGDWYKITSSERGAVMGIFDYEKIITAGYLFQVVSLNHNTFYNIICKLIAGSESREITSNVFLVDTTPPTMPMQSLLSDILVRPEDVAKMIVFKKIVRLQIAYNPELDAESGIYGYKIYGKTPIFNQYTEYASGNFTVTSGYQQVFLTLNNSLYTMVYAVQNKAGLWSPLSVEKLVDLRGISDMVDTLYNTPNPFNSNKQNTTIRYTMMDNADVDITIYDMFGYVVKRWSFAAGSAGGQLSNAIIWDGTNELGKKASKGGYILILKTNNSAGNKVEKKYLIGIIR